MQDFFDQRPLEQVLADLRARVKAWQEKTRDPWLVKYEHE